MPHVTCAFSTFGVQNVIPNGCWSVTASRAHGKATENRIAFEILGALVDAMVNISGFYVAVELCFLWRFGLRVAPQWSVIQCK